MKLSVVIPAFNEEGNIRRMYDRLMPVLESCSDEQEVIFVDDGSRDGTLGHLRELARLDRRVRYVSFSRNFGHEQASTAGLDRTTGDAVVLIDADLQDPPELIRELLARWREGAHVVYAQRRRREGESVFKRSTAFLFYRLIRALSDVDIPADTGDFRLMDRRVVEALRQCRESPRFVRGLVSWVGFKQVAVQYDRDERTAGETKYNFRKLLRLSLEAIFAFSLTPLRLTMWLGLGVTALSILVAMIVAGQRLYFGPTFANGQAGYALLACGLFLLGGGQLTVLGVMAHYLGHIFVAAKQRPLYLVAEDNAADAARHALHATSRDRSQTADGGPDLPRDERAGGPVLVVRRQEGHPASHD